MSVNIINTLPVRQYATNIQALLQQRGSRLRGSVMNGAHVGEQASPIDQVGAVEAQAVMSRFGPINRIDAAFDRRWVVPFDFEVPQLVDTFDKLRILNDPTSIYAQNAANALARKQDDAILTAMFGDAKTGKDGAGTTVFGATQFVSVNTGGAGSGMNVAKLRAARKILMANHVDLDREPVYCVITADDHDELLNEIQVINLDFNDKPVLVSGRVTSFLGINFIHSERITTATDDAAGTSKQIPVYVPSAMHFGSWGEIQTSVTQDITLTGHPWQVYAKATFGATRLEEKRIVRIWSR